MGDNKHQDRTRPGFSFLQKVWCSYHNTFFFSPPMCGRVIFKLPYRKKHHFAIKDPNGECDWYLVLMRNWLIVPYPSVCMKDLKEEIENTEKRFKEMGPPKDGEEVAYMVVSDWCRQKKEFLGND